MAYRTVLIIGALGFISTLFPANLPLPFGAVIAGVSFGVLLAAYLWTGDQRSWDLVTVPVALFFALPVAAASAMPVLMVVSFLTGDRIDQGVLDLLLILCMGASGALLVFATFVWFHLRHTFTREIGRILGYAVVPGIVSCVAYNLAGSPHPNALLAEAQPQIMIAWQTSVAVLIGFLEVAGTSSQTALPESGPPTVPEHG